jgi:hypothetical protein
MSDVVYFYECPTHGQIGVASVSLRGSPPDCRCPACGAAAELWLGPRPAAVAHRPEQSHTPPRPRRKVSRRSPSTVNVGRAL